MAIEQELPAEETEQFDPIRSHVTHLLPDAEDERGAMDLNSPPTPIIYASDDE
jgi:hypothetical protein